MSPGRRGSTLHGLGGSTSLRALLQNTKPPPCFPSRRLVVLNWRQKRLQRDDLSERAGDGARTRDSLLGRQELYH
jgi:hypothetical protein